MSKKIVNRNVWRLEQHAARHVIDSYAPQVHTALGGLCTVRGDQMLLRAWRRMGCRDRAEQQQCCFQMVQMQGFSPMGLACAVVYCEAYCGFPPAPELGSWAAVDVMSPPLGMAGR